MYYIIYKITNKINNKIYIGAHKTADINDRYMGSGKALTFAKQKYGLENFTKEILHVCNAAEDMYAKEAEIVNESFVARNDTYNIKCGGRGGWDHINNNPELKALLINKRKNDPAWVFSTLAASKKATAEIKRLYKENPEWVEQQKQKRSVALKEYFKNGGENAFEGKTHTAEARAKISKAAKVHQAGTSNSQYGTMWITDGTENRKVKCDSAIPVGWQQGTAQGIVTQQRKKEQQKEQQIAKQQAIVQKYRAAFEYYRDNNVSVQEVGQEFNISYTALYRNFKKYFSTEYKHVLESKK